MIGIIWDKKRQSLVAEIEKNNSQCFVLKHKVNRNKKIRAFMFFGYYPKASPLKDHFHKYAVDNKIPMIYFDSGIFKILGSKNNRFNTITINGIKHQGLDYLNYMKLGFSKWEKIKKLQNFKIENREKFGNLYSILGHNFYSLSLSFKTVKQQEIDLNNIIAQLESRKVEYQISHHPLTKNFDKKYKTTLDFNALINSSKCCIGWHSNFLCLAGLFGIPVVCLDDISFAKPISSDNIDNLRIVPKEERLSWAGRLCNSQFSKEEILNGRMFEKITPYIQYLYEKR